MCLSCISFLSISVHHQYVFFLSYFALTNMLPLHPETALIVQHVKTFLTSLLHFTLCTSPFFSWILKSFTCLSLLGAPLCSARKWRQLRWNTEVVNAVITQLCPAAAKESSKLCMLMRHSGSHTDGLNKWVWWTCDLELQWG